MTIPDVQEIPGRLVLRKRAYQLLCSPPAFVSTNFSLVEFRWTRSPSTLRFDAPFAFLGASVGDVALNQFHADFTREFVIPEVKGLRSFLTGSLGVTHLSAWSNLQSRGSRAARSSSAAVS